MGGGGGGSEGEPRAGGGWGWGRSMGMGYRHGGCHVGCCGQSTGACPAPCRPRARQASCLPRCCQASPAACTHTLTSAKPRTLAAASSPASLSKGRSHPHSTESPTLQAGAAGAAGIRRCWNSDASTAAARGLRAPGFGPSGHSRHSAAQHSTAGTAGGTYRWRMHRLPTLDPRACAQTATCAPPGGWHSAAA